MKIPTKCLEIPSDKLEKELLPFLLNKVFHVTDCNGFAGILSDGFIRSNKDKRYPFRYPQSENSYGRQRGYVCLFDLRQTTKEMKVLTK